MSEMLCRHAWCEWMLAASYFQDQQPAEAGRVLESGVARLRAVLERQPDDGETHGVFLFRARKIAPHFLIPIHKRKIATREKVVKRENNKIP